MPVEVLFTASDEIEHLRAALRQTETKNIERLRMHCTDLFLQTSDLKTCNERLRARGGKRPHRHRAAKKRDKLTPFHSIISSARTMMDGGIVRPSALAVFRLMTSSNLVGCWTGKSAGFAPLRIRPA
jgi:hypothetical protein